MVDNETYDALVERHNQLATDMSVLLEFLSVYAKPHGGVLTVDAEDIQDHMRVTGELLYGEVTLEHLEVTNSYVLAFSYPDEGQTGT